MNARHVVAARLVGGRRAVARVVGASRGRGRRAAGPLLVASLFAAGCGGDAPSPLRVTVHSGGLADERATAVATGDGRVLTVAHAVEGARSVRVDGRAARVVRVDRRRDVAELAVPGLAAGAARFARGGDTVEVHLLRGTVSARVLRRVTARLDGASRPALELATRVQPGDSGAPVTDQDGRLVGLVFARGDDSTWVAALTG
ncbi:trypsin-like peptidase domain-containing protein [Solirubrobacter phytolaccae]|uniref:Trypsin-like peptidase domain-containing protein n=1 Tax=Solirubrobacter phytolaccae TaxID=1404360 RepID=A0A9X3NF83_9ACTN|nr:trypsin-like peptidase domain-containing protein [Solirubrobacter phytolaccae]MDA0185590.1 trypsin-like peptidase domain-containing protein [Solirubrobacter phytolaccae]